MTPIEIINGVLIYNQPNKSFEKAYLTVRIKEHRLLDDSQVIKLPMIDKNHQNYAEWRLRKKSANRLTRYLKKKSQPITILDIGCGNGWFTNTIANVVGAQCAITAIDINLTELIQARRVFQNTQIEFAYVDIMSCREFQKLKFDCIILNASIQYFASAPELLEVLKMMLNMDGEIHILDSPFYLSSQIPEAKRRTKFYYEQKQSPEMIGYYFHHDREVLKNFNRLYSPSRINPFLKYLKMDDSPFSWYRFKIED